MLEPAFFVHMSYSIRDVSFGIFSTKLYSIKKNPFFIQNILDKIVEVKLGRIFKTNLTNTIVNSIMYFVRDCGLMI
jgi:hypothetical protein